jgi:pimeloyl-ACP methyl ester carboxylesterase
LKRILSSLLLGGTIIWAALFVWSPAPAAAEAWSAVRFAGAYVHHVAASPDGSYVYAVSSGDITQVRRHLDVSKDGGATWARVTPSSAPNMLAVSVANPEEIIAATNTGLYRSANAGTSWSRPAGPLVGSANFRSIARASSNPSVVWAQTQSVSGSSSLLKSSDGGVTWGLVSTLTPFHGAVMAIDPKDALTVYVAAFQKLHKTVDGGLTWTATLLGGQVDAISGVAIDPVNPAIVYLSGYPHTVKSVNGGVSFTTFGLGYYPSPTANRISGPVAVGPDQKLYLVGRASGSWQPKGVWQHDAAQWNQVPGLLITTNEVAPTATAVYAATEGGLYRLGYAPIAPPPPIPDTYPVIVIPGIMGSWKDHGVWRLDPISHTYDGLIAALVESGYREGIDLFPFPYEWRASNVDTAELLRAKIDQIQAQTGQAKVNIVAHSMGGLAARQYIQGIHYGNDVNKLILIGVPNLGAPNAYLVWEGEDFSYMQGLQAFILKQAFRTEAAKAGFLRLFDYIHQRVPSLGELLPIYNYLKDDDTGAWRNYPHRYPTNAFLENLELNRGQVTARGVQVFSLTGKLGPASTNGAFSVFPQQVVFGLTVVQEGAFSVMGEK